MKKKNSNKELFIIFSLIKSLNKYLKGIKKITIKILTNKLYRNFNMKRTSKILIIIRHNNVLITCAIFLHIKNVFHN